MIMTEICNNVYYLESNKRMRRTFNSHLDLYQTLFRTPLCFYYILPYILFILTQLDFELFKGKEIIFIFVLFFFLIFNKNTFKRSDYMRKQALAPKFYSQLSALGFQGDNNYRFQNQNSRTYNNKEKLLYLTPFVQIWCKFHL